MIYKTQFIRCFLINVLVLVATCALAQTQVDLTQLDKKGKTKVKLEKNNLEVTWPVENGQEGKILVNLDQEKPFFKSGSVGRCGKWRIYPSRLVRITYLE